MQYRKEGRVMVSKHSGAPIMDVDSINSVLVGKDFGSSSCDDISIYEQDRINGQEKQDQEGQLANRYKINAKGRLSIWTRDEYTNRSTKETNQNADGKMTVTQDVIGHIVEPNPRNFVEDDEGAQPF